MSRIDERTMIPLSWVVPAFVFLLTGAIGTAITATFWVSRVDTRIARIEKKLGIKDEVIAQRSSGLDWVMPAAQASR